MRKNKFKLIRNVTLVLICLIFLGILIYAYYNKTVAIYKSNTWDKRVLDASKIFNLDKAGYVDQKTPKDLFIAFSYASFYAWCGWFKEFPIAFNCLSATPPINLTNNERSELIIKCIDLSMLITTIQFSINDIPEHVTGDTCNITLGYGEHTGTFYLAKRKDGAWYFTERNFTAPKAVALFKKYSTSSYFLDEKGRNYTSPIACYLYFILGAMKLGGLDIDSSRKVLDLSWVDPIVRNEYGDFLVFVIQKVIEKEKVNIFAIPRSPIENTAAVILCTSEKLGYSIYLERNDVEDTNTSKWIFNKIAEDNALKIYSKEKMILDPEDPIWFRIQHWTANSLFNNTKLGAAVYSWILLIGGAIVAYVIYTIISKLLYYLFNKFSIVSTVISHYKKYTKRLAGSTALLIALYIFEILNYHNIIFYYQLYVWFIYSLYIAYTIVFTWFACELINTVCTITSYKLRNTSIERFKASFVIEIFQRLLSVLAIIVFTGILFQKLGINMLSFLTALGIGGVAVALAGKDTIENLFGSIIIALERPFKIGDWIIVDNIEGTVEHVGLRSTRIRTFEDSYITVPNVNFITSHVNNMNERSYRRYYTTLEVDESTTPEQLQSFTNGIDTIIKNTPNMRQNEYHIKVNDLAHFSIKIMIYVFFIAPDWETELQEREKFIVSILKKANELNIKISYCPTQTIYLSKKHEKSGRN